MDQNILTPGQYQDLARKIVHSLETRHRIIPINTLRHPKYHLKTPIYITLEHEKDQVIASFDDIEAFSYADTEFEAIDMLCQEIVDLYDDLRDDKENLGALPKKWLQYLETIIECR